MLTTIATHPLITRYGEFNLSGFLFGDNQQVVLVLWRCSRRDSAVLLRVQYGCITGTVFGARDCDCGLQVDAALERISKSDCGALVYFADHEAFGLGIAAKMQLSTIEKRDGILFHEALRAMNIAAPKIDVLWTLPHIFEEIKMDRRVIFLGTSAEKAARLRELGFSIVKQEELKVDESALTADAIRERQVKVLST